MTTNINWDKEISKLQSYQRLDDTDIYENSTLEELEYLLIEYSNKIDETNPKIVELEKQLNESKTISTLLSSEISLIERKIIHLKKKKNAQ